MQRFSSLSKCVRAMSSTQCQRNMKVGNWSQSSPVVMEEVSKDDFRTFRGARDMTQWFCISGRSEFGSQPQYQVAHSFL